MHLNISSVKCRPFLSRPHVLNGKSKAILHIVFSAELEQRLTKAYDVTIQRYHKLRTEIGQ